MILWGSLLSVSSLSLDLALDILSIALSRNESLDFLSSLSILALVVVQSLSVVPYFLLYHSDVPVGDGFV